MPTTTRRQARREASQPVRAKQKLDFEGKVRQGGSEIGNTLCRQGSAGRPPRPAAATPRRNAVSAGLSAEDADQPRKRACTAADIIPVPEPTQAALGSESAPVLYLSDEENDAALANNTAECSVAAFKDRRAQTGSPVAGKAPVPSTPATADRTGLLTGQGTQISTQCRKAD